MSNSAEAVARKIIAFYLNHFGSEALDDETSQWLVQQITDALTRTRQATWEEAIKEVEQNHRSLLGDTHG